MRDELQVNPGTVTGGPGTVTGALTSDTDPGLSFAGQYMTVPDSPSSSLVVADGGSGGMAVECFARFPSLPSSGTTLFMSKASSFGMGVTAGGHLTWNLANSGSTVTTISTGTVTPNSWYHLAGVCNGDYTGTPQFGNVTAGVFAGVPPDYRAGVATGEKNVQISRYLCLERGQVYQLQAYLQRYYDSTSYQWMALVAYDNSLNLLGQSAPFQNYNSTPAWRAIPLSFPVYPGYYWLGFVGGAMLGSDLTSIQIGANTTGNVRYGRNDPVTDTGSWALTGTAPDPLGAITLNDAYNLTIAADYTPVRTGDEGHSVLYINGLADNSSVWTHGVADTANDTILARDGSSNATVQLDDVSIWNRKLTPVEVARHYAAAKQ